MLQKYVPFPPGNQAGIHTGSIPFGDPETLPGVGGGPCPTARKQSDNVFFFSFSPQLI